MPGIVGLITRLPRKRAEEQLLRMVKSMLHEPFYRAGTWIDESLGVYIGWVERQEAIHMVLTLEYFASVFSTQNE